MRDRLKEVIISVTNRCNLNCRMCDIPRMSNGDEMTTDQIKQVIQDVHGLGGENIVLSGGEPLLRRDIIELVSFADECDLKACLTSNGILIKKEMAEELANSGMDIVNVSIEGPKEIHDDLRGEDSFEKSVNAIKNLVNNNIETTIAMTVLKQNYEHMPDIIELAQKLDVTTVKFQPFSDDFLLDKSERVNFLLSREDVEKLKLIVEDAIELSEINSININPKKYVLKLPYYLSDSINTNPLENCPSLLNSCAINYDGDVYACWPLSNRPLGNLKHDRFVNIWGSEKHRYVQNLVKQGKCPRCLMSCYDENFGKDEIRTRVVRTMRRSEKMIFGTIFKKMRGYLRRSRSRGRINQQNEIQQALREIEEMEKKFRDEINRLEREISS